MLRWFPRLQVASACFSCSPPDLSFLDPYFIFVYMHYNHCHRATDHFRLNILLLLLLLLLCIFSVMGEFLTLNMKVVLSFEEAGTNCATTRSNKPEDLVPQYENRVQNNTTFKSCVISNE